MNENDKEDIDLEIETNLRKMAINSLKNSLGFKEKNAPIKILNDVEVFTPEQIEIILLIKKDTQSKYRILPDNNPKKLNYIQLGRKVYYPKSEIEEWIKKNIK